MAKKKKSGATLEYVEAGSKPKKGRREPTVAELAKRQRERWRKASIKRAERIQGLKKHLNQQVGIGMGVDYTKKIQRRIKAAETRHSNMSSNPLYYSRAAVAKRKSERLRQQVPQAAARVARSKLAAARRVEVAARKQQRERAKAFQARASKRHHVRNMSAMLKISTRRGTTESGKRAMCPAGSRPNPWAKGMCTKTCPADKPYLGKDATCRSEAEKKGHRAYPGAKVTRHRKHPPKKPRPPPKPRAKKPPKKKLVRFDSEVSVRGGVKYPGIKVTPPTPQKKPRKPRPKKPRAKKQKQRTGPHPGEPHWSGLH